MTVKQQPIRYVLYTSRCTYSHSALVDVDIMTSAIRNNEGLSVTGFLRRERDHYIQYFEGPNQSITDLHSRIDGDARHSNMQVLQSGGVVERRFPNWSMGYSHGAEQRAFGSAYKIKPADVRPDMLIGFLQMLSQRHVDEMDAIGVPSEEDYFMRRYA